MVVDVNVDLIKTIDDSVDVPDYSEESDEEEEVRNLFIKINLE